jgi:hypothetical protein
LYEVESHVSNLEYDEFAMENRFAQEDEQAAMDDQNRQQAWFDEVNEEFNNVQGALENLKQADGTCTQENSQLCQELEGRLGQL